MRRRGLHVVCGLPHGETPTHVKQAKSKEEEEQERGEGGRGGGGRETRTRTLSGPVRIILKL